MKNHAKRIAILCNLDNYANSVRPFKIKRYLESKGHTVVLINHTQIYKTSHPNYLQRSDISGLLASVRQSITGFVDQRVNGWLYYSYLILKLKLIAHMLTGIIEKEKYDIIICENHLSAYVLLSNIDCVTILDLDSPYIEELYYTGKISDTQRNILNSIFKTIYSKADYLNFQWYKYTEYVKQNIYSGNNIVEINFGCTPKKLNSKAKYNSIPKIICLGYLGGKWNNLPLLSRLSKQYPIDVYGGPTPDKNWGLNYKGYAPTTDILKDYQFGLITISKDKLRRSSFSSKHLEYLSYGLPVLTPDWRKDRLLKDVSIYFNESNFIDRIHTYSRPDIWEKMSNRCYKQALEWQWNRVLKPLGDIVDKN